MLSLGGSPCSSFGLSGASGLLWRKANLFTGGGAAGNGESGLGGFQPRGVGHSLMPEVPVKGKVRRVKGGAFNLVLIPEPGWEVFVFSLRAAPICLHMGWVDFSLRAAPICRFREGAHALAITPFRGPNSGFRYWGSAGTCNVVGVEEE